ncbi:MAG: response regulator transcription factor [Chitinophagaceae bacterium]|nr:response regulator transcription factor [Chitinophagaceae bacterium]
MKKYSSLLWYGLALALLMGLLHLLEFKWYTLGYAKDAYIGFIAILFTALGIWLAGKLTNPKKETIIVERTIYKNPDIPFVRNETAVSEFGLSKRELEVLDLLAEGWSNQEIATKLFVSLSTIKTHVSGILEKLDVKRRIQAIEKAKAVGLLP